MTCLRDNKFTRVEEINLDYYYEYGNSTISFLILGIHGKEIILEYNQAMLRDRDKMLLDNKLLKPEELL